MFWVCLMFVKNLYYQDISCDKFADSMIIFLVYLLHLFLFLGINGCDWIILHPIHIGGRKFDPLQADFSQSEFSTDGYLITRNIFFSEKEKHCQPTARIPVEKISGQLLYLASGDDHNFDSAECARQLYERLRNCGKEDMLETVVYPGAGHLLEPPYSNHSKHSFHQKYNINLSFGGNVVDHARAQEDSWNRVINLLKDI